MSANIPVEFIDRNSDGTYARNDTATARMIAMLAEAGLLVCQHKYEDAQRIYQAVLDNAPKADQGTRTE